MASELKPPALCPFCGGGPFVMLSPGVMYHPWPDPDEGVCPLAGQSFDAVAWNRRAPSPEVEALVEAARSFADVACRGGDAETFDDAHELLTAALKPFEDDWEPPSASSGEDGA